MAPINDNFANSIFLNGSSVSAIGTNVGATGQTGEPTHAGVPAPIESVWWSWTAPTSDQFIVHTFGSDYDTVLGVYTGSAVNNLTSIGSNDDFSSPTRPSAVTLTATAGTTYRIAVDGFRDEEGAIALNIAKLTSGTSGADNLNGTSGSDWIRGSGGNDIINGNGGFDVLLGEGGNDQINGGSVTDHIDGGAGDDRINGNGGNDILFGREGNDTIAGSSSNEYIDGGPGNDTIYGNGGLDRLIGGDGNDLIYGGAQADRIDGGAGDDIIYGNGGADFIDSGPGRDTIWLGAGNATVVLNTGSGFDTINNFQLNQTRFDLGSGLSHSDLTFTNSAEGARISFGNDLLAVVSWNQASTFINNPSIFV